MSSYTYEPVPGLFKVTTWEENIVNSFGLQLPSWAAFCRRIEQLAAEGNGDIKVVYCARHGEAEHNVLSKKYGVSEYDAQRLYPITDPLLTAVGRRQAMTLGGVFAAESAQGMPLPTKFFVSPMRRPGETLGLEWGWLFKAGAVSRPGSPVPSGSGTPRGSLSLPGSPSKSGAGSRRPSGAGPALVAPAPRKASAGLAFTQAVAGSKAGRGAQAPLPAQPARSSPVKASASASASKPPATNNVATPVATPVGKPAAQSAQTSPRRSSAAASGKTSATNNVHVNVTEPSPTAPAEPAGPAAPALTAAESEELAHMRAILAGSAALALPEAQGGMSHGVPGLVIEELREHLHVHECDKRLTLTELRALFPHFTFPDGPDEDSVWQPLSVRGRETEDEMVARAGVGLGILFDLAKDDRYVSLTAHSGLLRAVYKNLGIPYRRLVTGEMNVLVIRVKRTHQANGKTSPL